MPAGIALAVYGFAVLLALALLHHFRACAWYWHVLSVVLAFVVGLVPIPAAYHSPKTDLTIGFFFLFLLLWGVCAPFFADHHHPRHRRPHHA